MRSYHRPLLLVLPTDELLRQPSGTEHTLGSANLSMKQLVEDILLNWIKNESTGYQRFDVCYYDPLDEIASSIIDTYLNEAVTPFLMFPSSSPVYDNIVSLIYATCVRVFTEILPIITDLNPTDYQLQTFRVRGWLSKSLVVEIPN